MHHLRVGGWGGVWVNAFRGELRKAWFPAPAARRLAEVGAPGWAVEIFDRLRAANGGTLSGFFDVFAWREPGRAGFFEAKVGPDRIKLTQLTFVETALRFHSLDSFMIVEIDGLSSQRAPNRQPGFTSGQAAARRPVTTGPLPGRRDLQPPLRPLAPPGPGHDIRREQRPRRTVRWTAADVMEAVASSGDDAATIARTVTGWRRGRTCGWPGAPGRPTRRSPSRPIPGARKVLAGVGCWPFTPSPHGGPPALEVRIKAMCVTPPYDRQQYRSRRTAGLHSLGIRRLDREADLSGLRPEILLSELTTDRLDRLLALISRWITDVRAHAAEPETTTQT